MKVLLYTEGYETIKKSGLGKAIEHQKRALEDNKIEYTTNIKDDFDILHINFYGPKSYLFAKKMRKKGKKIVYHAHSTEEDFRNSFHFSNLVAPLFKKWISKCYRLGDQIITPTEYSKRLLENYNLNRPIKAISNGVDTSVFERDEKAGEKFRKKYKFKEDDKVIVGIGLYIERKGILDFVELAKRLPEYKFIWFGYSPLWASPRKIKKAVNTKLDNLTFAGYVEQKVIASALSGADLYLFPTLEETEGIPIIEALTSKIPTLIRDIPVFEEYKNKKHVYKAKDIDDFEIKIEKILSGKLPDITESGYELAKNKDVKIVGKELIKTYKETLKMKRKEEKKEVNYLHFRTLSLVLTLFLIMITMLIKTKNYDTFKNIKIRKDYSKTIEINNKTIDITIACENEEKALKVLSQLELLYNSYEDVDKEVKNIKDKVSSKEQVEISDELHNLIKYGYEVYDKTDGKIKISNKMEDVDLKNFTVKNGTDIDINKIKYGYVNTKAISLLSIFGIDSYNINYSGYISVGNNYSKKKKYTIDLDSFDDKLNVTNKNISTSFNDDMVVTTVCNNTITCDIESNYLINLSVDDGKKYIKNRNGVEAIWSYNDNEKEKIVKSDGFDELK